MHPEQDQVLTDVCREPLISQADLAAAGVLPVPESAKKPPKPTRAGTLLLPEATGLVAARSAADKAVQLDAIAAHRRDFDRFRRARDAELRVARQVTGNG
ncbi:hypothetical protein [Nonomuraea jabiensis]|uniref:hypothetical protein n=1 Tax=Nonomuraea jabiensis TaxID=882448 RepID=UPI003D7109E1